MKIRTVLVIVISLAFGVGSLLVAVFALFVSQPRNIGFTKGSVKIRETMLGGEPVVILDGDYANKLGQLQGIGVHCKGNAYYLDQYSILWHPFARFSTHREWPVVIFTKELPPGRYSIRYWNCEEGYLSAGEFAVPLRQTLAGGPSLTAD